MKYLVTAKQSNIETAFCFDSHNDAVDYINECVSNGKKYINSIRETAKDKFEIKMKSNRSLIFEISEYNNSDIRFDLEYSSKTKNETRRYTRRELAVKHVTQILDEDHDCLVDPGENEMGEWQAKDMSGAVTGVAHLWLVILSGIQEKDDYSILGLKSTAKIPEVKNAYRKLSLKTHPDVGGNAAEFKRIHDAYQRIINGNARKNTRRILKKYQCSDIRYIFGNLEEELAKAKTFNDLQMQALYSEVRIKAIIYIFIGIIMAFIGSVLTANSYESSSDGTYTFFTGLIVVGGWNILKGLYYMVNPKAMIEKTKND